MGCRPEQEITEYGQTYQPLNGENLLVETNMNTPLPWSYSIPKDPKAKDLQVKLISPPRYGKNIECQDLGLTIKCTYVPSEDFYGFDEMRFQAVAGDFSADKITKITVKVNQCFYAGSEMLCPDEVEGVTEEDIAAIINFERPSDDIEDENFDLVNAGENTGSEETPEQSAALQVVYENAKELCKNIEDKVQLSQIITFPATDNCQFNEDANRDDVDALNEFMNGPRRDGRVRAHLRQDFDINLPDGAVLCDIDFDFPEQDMEYDDEIFLLLNNYVMLMSTDYSKNSSFRDYRDNGLAVNSQGLTVFNWYGDNDLYNLKYGRNKAPTYCQGVSQADPLYSQKCRVPKTESRGKIKLDIPKADIIRMGSLKMEESFPGMRFSFVSTGDNDDNDCEHSEYSFAISAQFVVSDMDATNANESTSQEDTEQSSEEEASNSSESESSSEEQSSEEQSDEDEDSDEDDNL